METGLLIVLVLVVLLQLTDQTDLYCRGVSEIGEQLEARCSYPNYKCSCINSPSDPPVCHCTRIVSEEEEEEQSTEATNTETKQQTTVTGWNPLYVLGVGCSILMVLILTSTACCCLCRQYYSQQMSFIKPPDYSDSPPPPYPATPSVRPIRTAVISSRASSREIMSAASRDLFSRETTVNVTSQNIAIREAPGNSVVRDLLSSRESFREGNISRESPQIMREMPLQHRSDLVNRDPRNNTVLTNNPRESCCHSQQRDSVIVSPRNRDSTVVRNPVTDNISAGRDELENHSSSRNTTVISDFGSSTIGVRRDSFTAPTTAAAIPRSATRDIETAPEATSPRVPLNTGITRGLREMSSTEISRPGPFLDRVQPGVVQNNTSPSVEINRPAPSLSRENTAEDGPDLSDQISTSGPVPAIVLPTYRQGRREVPHDQVARPGPSLLGRQGRTQNNASIMLPTYGQGLDLIVEDT